MDASEAPSVATADEMIASAGAAAGEADGPSPVPDEHRRPGRPRSERADRAIIEATLSLFAESGPAGLCIEKVAARAGVGKATIYRRWPGKEDLLLEAITWLKKPLQALCEQFADPRQTREFALLLGEGANYPRLMAQYLETVIEPRRAVIRMVLRRGVATGELREDTDVDAAMFMLAGAVLARSRYSSEPVEPGYAGRIVDELLAGLAAR